MLPHEQEFINFWDKKRKKWSWTTHARKTFKRFAIPLAILIDLMNFFVIGDTTYYFFSITHIYYFVVNLMLISLFSIMISGIFYWNMNEYRYWKIKRKYLDNSF
jgi:hypothetical protein